jgi:hypothetical protein
MPDNYLAWINASIAVLSDLLTIVAVFLAYLGLKQWRKQEYEKALRDIFMAIKDKAKIASNEIQKFRGELPQNPRGDAQYKNVRETFFLLWSSMLDLDNSINDLSLVKGCYNDLGDITIIKNALDRVKSIREKIFLYWTRPK